MIHALHMAINTVLYGLNTPQMHAQTDLVTYCNTNHTILLDIQKKYIFSNYKCHHFAQIYIFSNYKGYHFAQIYIFSNYECYHFAQIYIFSNYKCYHFETYHF